MREIIRPLLPIVIAVVSLAGWYLLYLQEDLTLFDKVLLVQKFISTGDIFGFLHCLDIILCIFYKKLHFDTYCKPLVRILNIGKLNK